MLWIFHKAKSSTEKDISWRSLPSSLPEEINSHVAAVNVRGSFVMYSLSVSFKEYCQLPSYSKITTIYKLIAAILDFSEVLSSKNSMSSPKILCCRHNGKCALLGRIAHLHLYYNVKMDCCWSIFLLEGPGNPCWTLLAGGFVYCWKLSHSKIIQIYIKLSCVLSS